MRYIYVGTDREVSVGEWFSLPVNEYPYKYSAAYGFIEIPTPDECCVKILCEGDSGPKKFIFSGKAASVKISVMNENTTIMACYEWIGRK